MWFVLSVLAFAAAVAGHALLRRSHLRLNPVSAFLAPGLPLGMVLCAVLIWRGDTPMQTIAALLSYALACELYIFLFTFISSSVTVSILLKLAQGSADWEKLNNTYSDEAMVDGRLIKLTRNALITPTASGYVTTPRGEALVSSFDRLRRFFKHSHGSAGPSGAVHEHAERVVGEVHV